MGEMTGKDQKVSGEMIRLYETDTNTPGKRTRRALALALGITEAELLFGGAGGRSSLSDPMLSQLMALYNGLTTERKFQLLEYANRLYAQEHPQSSVFNPYPTKPGQTPPRPRLVKK